MSDILESDILKHKMGLKEENRGFTMLSKSATHPHRVRLCGRRAPLQRFGLTSSHGSAQFVQCNQKVALLAGRSNKDKLVAYLPLFTLTSSSFLALPGHSNQGKI